MGFALVILKSFVICDVRTWCASADPPFLLPPDGCSGDGWQQEKKKKKEEEEEEEKEGEEEEEEKEEGEEKKTW